MPDDYYAVIMAGGGGTRLWPLSRRRLPKQALRLFGERSMFELAVDRLAPLFPPERILVVTVAGQADVLRAARPQVPPENFLLEPMPRGTASVVGLAAIHLRPINPQARMIVLTADHYIRAEARFREVLAAAGELARAGHMVTLGITPTFPGTGYGYIERGQAEVRAGGATAYRAARFKEKPPQELADQIWDDGRHSWNSGMFAWRVDVVLAEFERQMPALYSVLRQIEAAGARGQSRMAAVEALWPGLQPQTIDYGIMEAARDVVVIPVDDLGWTDVGSWETLAGLLPADAQGNAVVGGEHIALDTHGALVFASHDHDRRLIALIGLEGLAVVDTPDVLLICPLDRSQEVREIVSRLKQTEGGDRYL